MQEKLSETLLWVVSFSLWTVFSNLCKSRITWRMKWNVLLWKMMLQRVKTQFGETPDYGGRCHLIQLTWLSHILQCLMKAWTLELQTFPHWPVLKGNKVLVSWFQVARIVKDAEDSLCSLVPVFIKPPCERWGQLFWPPLVAWQLHSAKQCCWHANTWYNIYNLQY